MLSISSAQGKGSNPSERIEVVLTKLRWSIQTIRISYRNPQPEVRKAESFRSNFIAARGGRSVKLEQSTPQHHQPHVAPHGSWARHE